MNAISLLFLFMQGWNDYCVYNIGEERNKRRYDEANSVATEVFPNIVEKICMAEGIGENK